jgi:hypothetical protein
MVQGARRAGATHLMGATDAALHRWLVHFGLPYRISGPEVDYYGPVAPCIMSLSELDEIITSGRFPALKALASDGIPACGRIHGARRARRVLTASVLHTAAADDAVAQRLLGEFRRAAEQVPAYQVLLGNRGFGRSTCGDVWAFSTLCPCSPRSTRSTAFLSPSCAPAAPSPMSAKYSPAPVTAAASRSA